jgi:hypothetical protein
MPAKITFLPTRPANGQAGTAIPRRPYHAAVRTDRLRMGNPALQIWTFRMKVPARWDRESVTRMPMESGNLAFQKILPLNIVIRVTRRARI